jgi:formamidopyrimidine-DNA glycosylase
MPELAEVEYYRKRWNCGMGQRILSAELHADKRIYRGVDTNELQESLRGATLLQSEARGKQMAFQFSRNVWIAIHLGMTGKLRAEPPGFVASRHDHLLLRCKRCALVFNDPRQFGRVLYFRGRGEPPWWSSIAPALTSRQFTRAVLRETLERHARLPIKAALLLQRHFPGVGNWMADEILWQAGIDPRTKSGQLTPEQSDSLWKAARHVCREALRHVGEDFGDPPAGWLFHERWKRGGICPRHHESLARATVGGRTTAWCRKCQAKRRSG